MKLEFTGEAYESFQHAIASMGQYIVELTTQDGETFDAELRGPDHSSEWGDAVQFRRFDDERGAYGPVESARVERVLVY